MIRHGEGLLSRMRKSVRSFLQQQSVKSGNELLEFEQQSMDLLEATLDMDEQQWQKQSKKSTWDMLQ